MVPIHTCVESGLSARLLEDVFQKGRTTKTFLHSDDTHVRHLACLLSELLGYVEAAGAKEVMGALEHSFPERGSQRFAIATIPSHHNYPVWEQTAIEYQSICTLSDGNQ